MIKTLYSIDRRGLNPGGQTVSLTQPNLTALTAQGIPVDQDMLNREFPNGLSRHGQQYLLDYGIGDNVQLGVLRSTILELTLELVRRKDFPAVPSRFACVFACETVADVKTFASRGPIRSTGPIYEVFAKEYHKHDMNWLNWSSPVLGIWSNVHMYWGGRASETPFWEYLIPLPVRYGSKVDEVQ